jgi:hypothetical protein
MPEYRFYNLEQNGEVVLARVNLTLNDDKVAIASAQELIISESLEVWEGSRLVARIGLAVETPPSQPLPPATGEILDFALAKARD